MLEFCLQRPGLKTRPEVLHRALVRVHRSPVHFSRTPGGPDALGRAAVRRRWAQHGPAARHLHLAAARDGAVDQASQQGLPH